MSKNYNFQIKPHLYGVHVVFCGGVAAEHFTSV